MNLLCVYIRFLLPQKDSIVRWRNTNHFPKSTSLKLLLNLNIRFSEFVVKWSCSRMTITCLSRSYLSWKIGNSFTLPWEEVRNSTGHWKVIQEFKISRSVAWISLSPINSIFIFLRYSIFSPSRHMEIYTHMHTHTFCVFPEIFLKWFPLLRIEGGKKTRRFSVLWREPDSSLISEFSVRGTNLCLSLFLLYILVCVMKKEGVPYILF